MKKILFVITTCVLTTQGCTVYVGPAERSAHTHAPSAPVSATEYQGTEGEDGIRGPDEPAGSEGEAGELMERSSAVVPGQSPRPHTHAPAPESEPFGGKFWERIISTTVTVVAPVVAQSLLN